MTASRGKGPGSADLGSLAMLPAMEKIRTGDAPTPAGHYSQAVVHGGLVFVSGQLAVDPATGQLRAGSIEEQTRLTLANVAAILRAAGSDVQHVLKTTVYVPDIALWGRVNQAYAERKLAGMARGMEPVLLLRHGLRGRRDTTRKGP